MRPLLVLVVDVEGARREGLVRDVALAGVDWIQLRDRAADAATLLRSADGIREAAPMARLVVNRRVDVALASGADGAHLGFDAVEPTRARALLGDDALVGVSAHAPEEVERAEGASYAHLAPIHTPLSKPAERPSLGLDALRRAAGHGLPVIAQGGIDAKTARDAIDAGARGVAVTGAILRAEDPARAARALREALDA